MNAVMTPKHNATTTPRHRGDDPDDLSSLNGEWHIGRYWPGMFPLIEASCDCPKAACGLVIPDPAIPCTEHHGDLDIRQAHKAGECPKAQEKTGPSWWPFR